MGMQLSLGELDVTITDIGAGQGRFKSPSLRNIAVRPPYMHDGRFQTLEQVVALYDSGVQANPDLDNRLRAGPGQNAPPLRLNLTAGDRAALVALLGTLTDTTFLTDVRFGNPFARQVRVFWRATCRGHRILCQGIRAGAIHPD